MELITSYLVPILIGIGLSAAVGFRIFVPFLVMGLIQRFGIYSLPAGFEWLSQNEALLAFGIATIIEIIAYFVPWLDSALDLITTPLAMIGGTIMMGSSLYELDPLWKWSLAILAGGSTAGLIKSGNTGLRLLSTATTGGLGNFIIAVGELFLSILFSLLSAIIPFIIFIAVLICLYFFGIKKYFTTKENKSLT